jgi:DNA-binding NtrC family response regulator
VALSAARDQSYDWPMSRTTTCSVMFTFASLHGDPYPRDSETGEYRERAHDDPTGWGPTLRAVADPRSPLFGRVSDVYYLCHPAVQGGRRRQGRSASEVAADTKAAIERHLKGRTPPQFHAVTWATDRPPNNHAHLFEVACRELRAVRATHPDAEVVVQLGTGTASMHAVLLLAGSVGVISGPVRLLQAERAEGVRRRPDSPLAEVDFKLDTILQLARQTTPATSGGDEAPSPSFDQARSRALRLALEEARRAARVRFPILLRGERGVGKSTIACLIRAASPFRDPHKDSAWPSVACGQFTDADRLNAELCGAARGAYTGAAKDRWGLLHAANGDTLFLDEIHDLDPRSQRALIRVLEEGVYYRLGENTPRRSNFRLISGTNQPDDVLRVRLAPDFLDRIRDIEVVLPPLRDCREDLPWMWRDTWERVAREGGLKAGALRDAEPDIVRFLATRSLPGNWRDLRRLAVRLAVLHTDARPITRKELHQVLDAFAAADKHCLGLGIDALPESPRLVDKRDENQLRRLEAALGPGLSKLWDACRAGRSPQLALGDLLKDRHRAQRAGKFISRTFPEPWQRASGRG